MSKKRTAFTLIELSIVLLIIGIITTGITQSSRLISGFRLSSAQNLTKNSPVSSIEGLTAWWETTMEGNFIDKEMVDGGAITRWNDINPQINNKHNIIQATLTPSYAKSAINNLPALLFDGTTDYLEFPYNADFASNDFTFFAVMQPLVAPAATAYGTILSNCDLTAKGFSLYISSGLQYQTWLGINNTTWQGATILSTATKLKKSEIISATYNSSSGSYKLYQNTVLKGTGAYTPYTINTQRPLRIGAGQNESTPTSYFNGYISEIIIFNRALKFEERLSVETYLKKKWGI